MATNPEQLEAVNERGHCVVLAGPGSGKTKTLTTAMARTLIEDVLDPRGVACITYNTECAIELETRLSHLGIESGDQAFIGTVHGFALSQIIAPYARCVLPELPPAFRVATKEECRNAVERAYYATINEQSNPQDVWAVATEKRKRDVDRNRPEWRGRNPELASFIEAYEANLRDQGLLDFEDMPLLAYKLVRDHGWIRDALCARFPVLFVDEYQDLGHALHELVLLLCFQGGMRLFAVGDADQSIYGFNGANPELLQGLTQRHHVRTISLKFNYRSGARIIRASLGALGEDRDYRGVEGAPEGELNFWCVQGGHDAQAGAIAHTVLPNLLERGYQLGQIAILYRNAKLGDKVAAVLKAAGIAYVRTDGNALIKRSSRFARFVEGCAAWVCGGWRDADPPYQRLLYQAKALVFAGRVSDTEEQALSKQLISFLSQSIGTAETAHDWLLRFRSELVEPWQQVTRNLEWEGGACDELVTNTDPAKGLDVPLPFFAGKIEGAGRVSLSTLHSAKGREFDVVIMFGVSDGDMPSRRDKEREKSLREARRLFYVGVTRPRLELHMVYEEHRHSAWLTELWQRSQM